MWLNDFIISFGNELYFLVVEMAPYLLLGFLIAGILYVFIPEQKITKHLGKKNASSVIKASVFGIPLPLCSCGVLPTGISMYKNGASKGSAVSFLISTPQTGVDSILVTYSLIGLPFAIIRPIVAFFTGIVGGFATNISSKNEPEQNKNHHSSNVSANNNKSFLTIFTYAFYDFLKDIAKWLVIGLLVAAFISALIPDSFFENYLRSDFLGMLIILVASIPLYVCATSSVPIAAVLLLKGLSPGAALVFLMAGPATNAATITVIGKTMGKKTLYTYLGSIIGGALIFGYIIDAFLPAQWFNILNPLHNHNHTILPGWLQISSAIIISIALINVFVQKLIKKYKKQPVTDIKPILKENEIKVIVEGMECNHCKANVESNVGIIEGIESLDADLDTEVLTIVGKTLTSTK